MEHEPRFVAGVQVLLRCILMVLILIVAGVLFAANESLIVQLFTKTPEPLSSEKIPKQNTHSLWQPPDSLAIPQTPEGDLIRYGRELVAHTASYLGPKGKVGSFSNGMNCQNCHLKAGKKIFGNNYSAVASTYPRFRARSGTIESIEKRVNDCIERSLNGKSLKNTAREMQAFVAYISWVGKNVRKGEVPGGAGLVDLPLLDRAADAVRGKIVFEKYCVVCHGKNGEGLQADNGLEWKYPPLYGMKSYNTAAGLYRLSRFAGYIKANMPNGATYEKPVLTDEEAWDVAAFINSQARPEKKFKEDWPDLATKPFDHPFGPYADDFTEREHKFGPFGPIKKSMKK